MEVLLYPIAGAWERVSDTDQGILVLTETHFSMVVMPKNRQRSERSEPTPEEAMAAYRDLCDGRDVYGFWLQSDFQEGSQPENKPDRLGSGGRVQR